MEVSLLLRSLLCRYPGQGRHPPAVVKTSFSSFLLESVYCWPCTFPWNSPSFSVLTVLSISGLPLGSACWPWNCREIFLRFFSWPSTLLTSQATSHPKQCEWLLGIYLHLYLYFWRLPLVSPHSYLLLWICTVEFPQQPEIHQVKNWDDHPAPFLSCFPNLTAVYIYECFTSATVMVF